MAEIDPSVGDAYQDVRSDKSDTNWAVFGYDKGSKNKITLQGKGNGEWSEFAAIFEDSQPQYGFVRVISGDQESKRAKFIFVSWIGKHVGVLQKAKVSVHKASVKEVIRDFAVEIAAEEHVDLDEDVIMDRVRKAGGANYDSKHNLAKKIESRPSKKELEDKNIMKKGAPRLQDAAEQLRKEKLTDNLEKKVTNRPEKEDLENRNILKQGNVAPSLQAAQIALEHERKTDTLEKKKEDLENRNILKQGNVAPSLQAAQAALQHEKLTDTLEKKGLK